VSDPKRFPRGLLSLVLFLSGCTSTQIVPATGTGTTTSKVTGSVTYRERIALPPSAVITVKLVDVSLADAPAVLIAEQVIATAGRQVPFEFALEYDAARIQPSHTYAVHVRIENGDRLLFISDKMNLVITRDAPSHLDIVVRRI
jgi:putative lipoprotein